MDVQARRDTLVGLLRRGGQTTVEQLAGRLEVSRRTVLRDIGVLRARGFRIESEGGRGGGVRMDPGTVLVSAQLSAEDVVGLVLSIGVLEATPSMPFAARARSALARIEGALPRARVLELRRLLRRVLVGEPARLATGDAPGSVDPRLLSAFERAFTQRRPLRFSYVDRHGQGSARTVEPHGLLVRIPLWYVLAWDADKHAPRLFRMDRIRAPRVVESAHFPARPLKLVAGVCPDATPARTRSRGR